MPGDDELKAEAEALRAYLAEAGTGRSTFWRSITGKLATPASGGDSRGVVRA